MDPSNTTNQFNVTQTPIGSGHNRPHTDYQGTMTKTDPGNHANQMNPNNSVYDSGRGGDEKGP
uniref:Uncharacterized protein n=1 Tax=Tetranychus urticae TaxID=32264 RepID=T1L0T7_TETUR